MEEKQVILQRKQGTEFTINYPYGQNGRIAEYKFMGSKTNKPYERPIPMEVFEWLTQYTSTISGGHLIIKPTEDEDVKYIRESIEDIENVEASSLNQAEVIAMLEKGNQNVLKKALRELVEGKSEEIVKSIKKQIKTIAGDQGIDSDAKKKVLCDFLGLDYEKSSVIFESDEN